MGLLLMTYKNLSLIRKNRLFRIRGREYLDYQGLPVPCRIQGFDQALFLPSGAV